MIFVLNDHNDLNLTYNIKITNLNIQTEPTEPTDQEAFNLFPVLLVKITNNITLDKI